MEKKNYRTTFRQKKNEVHTTKEIASAFEHSFSACFALSEDCAPGARMQLFSKIWEINPDAIITEADLFVVQSDPVAAMDQYLVIGKNGTKETNALLARCLEESGIITSPWYIQSKKQGGIKTCYLGNTLHNFLANLNAHKVSRIVERAEGDTSSYCSLNIFSYKYTAAELFEYGVGRVGLA